VECLRPVSADPGAEPFWFLDVLRHHLSEDIEHKADASVVVARREFCRRWCYPHTGKWADNACLLSYGLGSGRTIRFLERAEGREFIPYAGLYSGMLMGALDTPWVIPFGRSPSWSRVKSGSSISLNSGPMRFVNAWTAAESSRRPGRKCSR
jgi:hypothetical protein